MTHSPPVYTFLSKSTSDVFLHTGHCRSLETVRSIGHVQERYPHAMQWWADISCVQGAGQFAIAHGVATLWNGKREARCSRSRDRKGLPHSIVPCPNWPHVPHLCAEVRCVRLKRQPDAKQSILTEGSPK